MRTRHHPKTLVASVLVGVLAVSLIAYTASASTTVGTDISTGGTLTVGGTAAITGATTLTGALTAAGLTYLSGNATTNALNTNPSTLSVTVGTATVNGNTTLGDASTDTVTITGATSATGTTTIALPATGKLYIDGTTTANTGTAGALDIDVRSATDGSKVETIDFTFSNTTTSAVGIGRQLTATVSGGLGADASLIGDYILMQGSNSDGNNSSLIGQSIVNNSSATGYSTFYGVNVVANGDMGGGGANLTNKANSVGYNLSMVKTAGTGSIEGFESNITNSGTAGVPGTDGVFGIKNNVTNTGSTSNIYGTYNGIAASSGTATNIYGTTNLLGQGTAIGGTTSYIYGNNVSITNASRNDSIYGNYTNITNNLGGSPSTTGSSSNIIGDVFTLTNNGTATSFYGDNIGLTNAGTTSTLTGSLVSVTNTGTATSFNGLSVSATLSFGGTTTNLYGLFVQGNGGATTQATPTNAAGIAFLDYTTSGDFNWKDGLLIDVVNSTDAGQIIDGVDVSDQYITNAINVGTNTIMGSGSTSIDLSSSSNPVLTITNSSSAGTTSLFVEGYVYGGAAEILNTGSNTITVLPNVVRVAGAAGDPPKMYGIVGCATSLDGTPTVGRRLLVMANGFGASRVQLQHSSTGGANLFVLPNSDVLTLSTAAGNEKMVEFVCDGTQWLSVGTSTWF